MARLAWRDTTISDRLVHAGIAATVVAVLIALLAPGEREAAAVLLSAGFLCLMAGGVGRLLSRRGGR